MPFLPWITPSILFKHKANYLLKLSNSQTLKLSNSTMDAVKVTKTLPMKYKTMQCAIVGFLKKAELDGLVASELSESLIARLPLYGTVEDQVKYYDDTIDIKHVEQVIIKPRIQEFKKANKPVKAEKPKKERSKPKEKKDGSSTPVLPKKDTNQPAAPKKSRKPTEIVFSHDDDEVSTKLEFDEELPTEEYVVTTEPEPEPKCSDGETTDAVTETESIATKEPVIETKKAKVIKKREPKAKKAAATTETDGEKPKKKRVTKKKEITPPEEAYMVVFEGIKYWCGDENEKNGYVFENTKNDEGDSAPGKKVGELKDGVLKLDK